MVYHVDVFVHVFHFGGDTTDRMDGAANSIWVNQIGHQSQSAGLYTLTEQAFYLWGWNESQKVGIDSELF